MANYRNLIIAAAIALITGLLLGYNLNGDQKDAKADPKTLIRQAGAEIAQLKKQNQDMKKELETARKEALSKNDAPLKEQLTRSLKDNEAMENQISRLTGQLKEHEERLSADRECQNLVREMSKRTADLEKENQELNNVIETIDALSKQLGIAPPVQPR